MMLSRTLISRPNLEKLIRMADLDLNVKNKVQQEALIDDLTSSLKILGLAATICTPSPIATPTRQKHKSGSGTGFDLYRVQFG